ncbi:hypothetical protein WIV_gp131 [Wiseana iridescent virus]|uniref:Uncharacterized protein n=1 Tax=Wiseana iridescent virus TaxID=68347 RepID=G0T5F7_IRV9|nr:hypothetical protein WIV_gp131 [Wiseana iridescent virus]ADO00475.1 hypothetical protein [Wiseana iridescent virus]
METSIKLIFENKLTSLVDFILSKNPNADKGKINHKISQLGLFQQKKVIPRIQTKLIDKLVERYQIKLKVKKTTFGNYVVYSDENDPKFEDLQTNKFVLSLGSKTIIGIENANGEVEPLNKVLVEVCHKYKLKYEMPLNLNTSDDPEQDEIIEGEICGLGLNYAESEAESDEE